MRRRSPRGSSRCSPCAATSGCSTSAAARARSRMPSRPSHARSSRSTATRRWSSARASTLRPTSASSVGDGERLPFDDGEFDVAATLRTLHHTPHPELLVAELARVTKPGGIVLVVDQLAPVDEQEALALNEFERARDASTSRVLAEHDLRALFDALGLDRGARRGRPRAARPRRLPRSRRLRGRRARSRRAACTARLRGDARLVRPTSTVSVRRHPARAPAPRRPAGTSAAP